MNGWFDKGSDAGGFIQMPGYSPASAVLGVGNVNSGGLPTQAAVDQIFSANPTQYAGYYPCNGWAVDNGGGPNGALDGKADFNDCTRAATAAGKWTASNGSEIYFNPDGSPFVLAGAHGYNGPIDTASAQDGKIGTGYAGVRLQPNGNLGQVAYVGQAQSSEERHSLFGRATHELNDNLTAFAQANYASYAITTTGGYPPAITVWSAPVPLDARPIPAALKTLLASRTNPDQSLDAVPRARLPRRRGHDEEHRTTCSRSWRASTASSATATGPGKCTSPRVRPTRRTSSTTCRRCSATRT